MESQPPIYLVSGSTGHSGEQLVKTALAQFPDNSIQIVSRPHIRRSDELEPIVTSAAEDGGTIVHTLVDTSLRHELIERSEASGVPQIDLMGGILARIADALGRDPAGRPGLYRRARTKYFDRIKAMEYTMHKDDGSNPKDWAKADIVLVGVSRVGKTPLSMYLSMLGWKVANIPIVPDVPVPDSVFELDSRRVFGLVMNPEELKRHRQARGLGSDAGSDYTGLKALLEEMERVREICRRGRFTVRDVGGKPIETTANELLALLNRRFGDAARQ